MFPSTLENKTQSKENKSVLKQIESLLNDPDVSLQHNKLSVSSTKATNDPSTNQNKNNLLFSEMSVGDILKQCEKFVASFEYQAARETKKQAVKEDKDDRESDDEDLDKENEEEPLDDSEDKDRDEKEKEEDPFSAETDASIQRFRFFISSLSGGNGREHPVVEEILAENPDRENDILEAAMEFCQDNLSHER